MTKLLRHSISRPRDSKIFPPPAFLGTPLLGRDQESGQRYQKGPCSSQMVLSEHNRPDLYLFLCIKHTQRRAGLRADRYKEPSPLRMARRSALLPALGKETEGKFVWDSLAVAAEGQSAFRDTSAPVHKAAAQSRRPVLTSLRRVLFEPVSVTFFSNSIASGSD